MIKSNILPGSAPDPFFYKSLYKVPYLTFQSYSNESNG